MPRTISNKRRAQLPPFELAQLLGTATGTEAEFNYDRLLGAMEGIRAPGGRHLLTQNVNLNEGEGNQVAGPNAGILGRIFDVASRSNYAMANAAKESPYADQKPGGLLGGITDVLDVITKINPLTGLGGALTDTNTPVVRDIGSILSAAGNTPVLKLDPSFGAASNISDFLKGLDSGAGAGNSFRGTDLGQMFSGLWGTQKTTFSDRIKEQGGGRVARGVGGFGLDVALDPLTYTGAGVAKEASKAKAITELGREAVEKTAGDFEKLLPKIAAAPPDDVGRIVWRVGGSEVLSSEAAYKYGKQLIRPLSHNKAGEARWLNRALNLKSHLPSEAFDAMRKANAIETSEADKLIRSIAQAGETLNTHDRRLLTQALESGKNLHHMAAPENAQGLMTLDDHLKLIKGVYDQIWHSEREIGRFAHEVEPAKNYFYKVSKTGKKIDKAKPINELLKRGDDVVDDAYDALILRVGKHARIMTRDRFVKDIVNTYGVDLRKIKTANKRSQSIGRLKSMKNVDWEDAGKIRRDLKGVYLPKEVAETLRTSERIISNDKEAAQLLKIADKATSAWKFWTTMPNPGFHVRNMASDLLMNASAGHLEPSNFGRTAKILGSFGKTAQEAAPRLDPVLKRRVLKENLDKAGKTVRFAGRDNVPVEQVYNLFHRSGAIAGFLSQDIDRATKGLGELSTTAAGKQLDKAAAGIGLMAQNRENFARLSHFLSYVEKEAKKRKIPMFLPDGKTFTKEAFDLAEEAGKSIRKWNLDYGALTPFERRVVKRVIPFYSFIRLNFPRQLELLFTKPGFVAAYPKSQNFVQQMLGTSESEDSLLPQWIRESLPIRLAAAGSKQVGPMGMVMKALGIQEGNQATFNMGAGFAPIGDLNRLTPLMGVVPGTQREGSVSDIVGNITQDVSPLIRAPFEISTGKQIFTGNDIPSLPQYLANQIPATRMGSQAVGGDLSRSSFMRWLTGVPIQEVTPDRQQGEFRRREDILTAGRRARAAELGYTGNDYSMLQFMEMYGR